MDPAFDAPTVAALSHWLYAPHLVDGVPVDRPGVQVTMRYRFD